MSGLLSFIECNGIKESVKEDTIHMDMGQTDRRAVVWSSQRQ